MPTISRWVYNNLSFQIRYDCRYSRVITIKENIWYEMIGIRGNVKQTYFPKVNINKHTHAVLFYKERLYKEQYLKLFRRPKEPVLKFWKIGNKIRE